MEAVDKRSNYEDALLLYHNRLGKSLTMYGICTMRTRAIIIMILKKMMDYTKWHIFFCITRCL